MTSRHFLPVPRHINEDACLQEQEHAKQKGLDWTNKAKEVGSRLRQALVL
jgi:hypothetical protein